MSEMDPRVSKRLVRLFVLGLPLLGLALDFVLLLVTYVVLASIAPDVLGKVAVSPARFAAWITLVRLPMTIAYLVAVSGRALKAALTTGEVPDLPVRKGWRRVLVTVRDVGAETAWSVAAALIVFGHMVDPDAQVWHLVAVTAVGPYLLSTSVTGPFRLLAWWWRTRPSYRARHARPDKEQSADRPDEVGENAAQCGEWVHDGHGARQQLRSGD